MLFWYLNIYIKDLYFSFGPCHINLKTGAVCIWIVECFFHTVQHSSVSVSISLGCFSSTCTPVLWLWCGIITEFFWLFVWHVCSMAQVSLLISPLGNAIFFTFEFCICSSARLLSFLTMTHFLLREDEKVYNKRLSGNHMVYQRGVTHERRETT